MEFILSNMQAFIGVLSIWILAVMMPGPDMFFVIRTAVNQSRMAGIMAMLGIISGTIVWLMIGFFVVGILSESVLFDILRICGGTYLIWMAYKIFSSLKQDSTIEKKAPKQQKPHHVFYAGFLTNIANPKPPIFVSIILARLPVNVPFFLEIALFLVMLAIPLVWFYIVVRLFSIRIFLDRFMKYSKLVDVLAALVFGIFGLDLVYEGVSAVKHLP